MFCVHKQAHSEVPALLGHVPSLATRSAAELWVVCRGTSPLTRNTLRSSRRRSGKQTRTAAIAVGETVILLHPPLPLVGVPIGMERERQQNDSLANG